MKSSEAKILAKAVWHFTNDSKRFEKKKQLTANGFYSLTDKVSVRDMPDLPCGIWLEKSTEEPQYKGEPLVCVIPFEDCYSQKQLYRMLKVMKWIYI